MKKTTNLTMALLIAIASGSASCNNHYNEIQTVIDKYCLLNMEAYNAPEGPQKDAATAKKEAYEKEVDDKYFKDYKNYQLILKGMKACDEALTANTTETP